MVVSSVKFKSDSQSIDTFLLILKLMLCFLMNNCFWRHARNKEGLFWIPDGCVWLTCCKGFWILCWGISHPLQILQFFMLWWWDLRCFFCNIVFFSILFSFLTWFLPVQLQIEDLTRKLRTGDLGIPPNPEDRLGNSFNQLTVTRFTFFNKFLVAS